MLRNSTEMIVDCLSPRLINEERLDDELDGIIRCDELETFIRLIQMGDVTPTHKVTSGDSLFALSLCSLSEKIFTYLCPLVGDQLLNERFSNGDNALMRLCRFAYCSTNNEEETRLNMAKKLIDSGLSVNQQNSIGETALFIAAKNNFKSMIRLLASYGANVDKPDDTGKTPLYAYLEESVYDLDELKPRDRFTCGTSYSFKTLELLCCLGADVKAKCNNEFPYTPFDIYTDAHTGNESIEKRDEMIEKMGAILNEHKKNSLEFDAYQWVQKPRR